MSSVIENSAFLKSSKAIGSNLSATGAPFSHVLAPRAVMGQSASTRPRRTPTYQSSRLTVGSQSPAKSQLLLAETWALWLGADSQLAVPVRDIAAPDVRAAVPPGRTFLAAVGLQPPVRDGAIVRGHADHGRQHEQAVLEGSVEPAVLV